MAEMMMFQPGLAFMDAYNKGRSNSLQKLAMTDPSQRKSALADLAGIDPNAARTLQSDFDEKDKADFSEWAGTLLNVAPEIQPQVYQAGLSRWGEKFRRMGVEPPADYKQALPSIQAWAGASQEAMPADIRTNQWYLKQLGYKPGSKEEQDFLRMRAGQIPKAVPYGFKYDEQGNVWVEDKNQGEIRPGQFGGQNPPPQAGGQVPPPAGSGGIVFPEDIPPAAARVSDIMDAARREIGQLVASGMPVDQATSIVTQKYAKGRGLTMPQQGQAPAVPQTAPPAMPQATQPQSATSGQARIGVKPPEAKVETWGAPTAVVKNGKTVMIQLSNLGNERVRSDLSPADSNKAPSGEASNAAGFFSRMQQSERLISQIESGGYSPSENKGDFFTAGGTFTNWATSPKGRQYYNAASNWIRANLRKESGAAIGVDEMKQEFATYFPVPGDDKDTIEQKRLLRQQTAEAVRQAGAPAMRYQERNQGQQGQNGSNFDPLGILK